jgi:hypothetical protein
MEAHDDFRPVKQATGEAAANPAIHIHRTDPEIDWPGIGQSRGVDRYEPASRFDTATPTEPSCFL